MEQNKISAKPPFEIDIVEKQPYQYAVEPFHMIGNLYYVGNEACSAHLIDTGDGLILIDTPFPSFGFMLVDSIYKLGFSPYDIRYIIHTHEHCDHIGCSSWFRALYGCKLVSSKVAADIILNQTESCLGGLLHNSYMEPFAMDIALNDGESIVLGNTTVRLVTTPGHSKGEVSLFFNIEEEGRQLTCGMFGGIGFNTLSKQFLLEHYGNEEMASIFRNSLQKVQNEKVDILLGNHPKGTHTFEKQARKAFEETNPFIDDTAWEKDIRYILASFDDFKNGES